MLAGSVLCMWKDREGLVHQILKQAISGRYLIIPTTNPIITTRFIWNVMSRCCCCVYTSHLSFLQKGNFGCSDILRTIWQKVATAIFALLTGQCHCSALGLFGPSWCHEYLHACKVGSSCICTVNLFHDSRPPTHQTSTFTIGRGTNKTSNISQRF